jgi:DNA-binding transcriptional LysR family regulator
VHLNRLDLNLLVALHALLIEQNVSRAAARLHLSQPAMSGSLQRLRAHLKDPLLEPAGNHRLKLTPRARRLVGPVQDLLSQIQSTLSGDPDFDPATAKQDVHIAMSSYCAHVLGSRLIADMHLHAPRMKCRLHELSRDSVESVTNGDLDFCISLSERAYLDPASRHMQLRAEATFRDRFVIVASSQNVDVSKSLTLETYRELPSVEVRLYDDVLSVPERILACYDKPVNVVAVVPGFHSALAAVSGSKSLVAIVPALLVEALGKALDLKSYEPAFGLPEVAETLIWHQRNESSAAHVWFRKRVRIVASSLAGEGQAGKREIARLSLRQTIGQTDSKYSFK